MKSSVLLFLAVLLTWTNSHFHLPKAAAGDGHSDTYEGSRTLQKPRQPSQDTIEITQPTSEDPADQGDSPEIIASENAELFEASIRSYLAALQEAAKTDEKINEDYDFQLSVTRWSVFLAKYKGFTKNIGRIIRENPEFIYFNAVITLIKYPTMAALTWSGYGALASVLLAIPDTVIANGFYYKIRRHLDSKYKKQNFGYSLAEFEALKRQLIGENNSHDVHQYLVSNQGNEVLVPVSSKGIWTLTQRIKGAAENSSRVILTESDLESILRKPALVAKIKGQIPDPYLYQSILIQAIFQDAKKRDLLLEKADGLQDPKNLRSIQRDLFSIQQAIALLNFKESTAPASPNPSFFERLHPSRIRNWFRQKANYTVAKRALRDLEYALVVEYLNDQTSQAPASSQNPPPLKARISSIYEQNGFPDLANAFHPPCALALRP